MKRFFPAAFPSLLLPTLLTLWESPPLAVPFPALCAMLLQAAALGAAALLARKF